MISITQSLVLLIWLSTSGLIFLLALIARFYEVSSAQRTYYRGYILPLICFTLSSARYIFIDRWAGDPVGDALLITGGAILAVICVLLYQLMTTEKP